MSNRHVTRAMLILTCAAIISVGAWSISSITRSRSTGQDTAAPLSDIIAVAETIEPDMFSAFPGWFGLPGATVRWRVRMPARLRGSVLETEVPNGGCGAPLHEGGLFALRTHQSSKALRATSCTLVWRQADPDAVRTGGCTQPPGSLGVRIPLADGAGGPLARDYVDRVDDAVRRARYGFAVAWDLYPGWVIIEVFTGKGEADPRHMAALLRAADVPPHTAIEDGSLTLQAWPEKEPSDPSAHEHPGQACISARTHDPETNP